MPGPVTANEPSGFTTPAGPTAVRAKLPGLAVTPARTPGGADANRAATLLVKVRLETVGAAATEQPFPPFTVASHSVMVAT